MTMSFRKRSATPLVALVMLLACQPDHDWHDDYTFVWERQHVTVYGYERSEQDACAGSFEALERHSETIIELFEFDDSTHYDYHWMSQEFWKGKCPLDASACNANYDGPRTRSIPDMHEVSHALSWTGRGERCPSVLEEGLAEYLSGPGFFKDKAIIPKPELPVRLADILTRTSISSLSEYERAGHFASFLVESYGPKAVSDLCLRIPVYHGIEDWEAAVPELLGVSLTELLAEYEQYPICSRQHYRARLWECDGEADVVANPDQGQEVEFEIAFDCADPGMIGPLNGRAVATRLIWFPEGASTAIYVRDEDGATPDIDFNLQECAPCSANPKVHTSANEATDEFDFNAGMYELILFGEIDRPQKLTIRLVTW